MTNTYANANTNAMGSFSLAKVLSGITAAEVPAGTTFTVVGSWSVGEARFSRTFNLDAAGAIVTGPQLPVGTVVTFSEVNVPQISGYTFEGVTFAPATVTIADGSVVAVTVTNTYKKVTVTQVTEEETKKVDETTATESTKEATKEATATAAAAKKATGQTLSATGAPVLGLAAGALTLLVGGALLIARRRIASQL